MTEAMFSKGIKMKKAIFSLTIIMLFVLGGCIDTEQEIFLNTDGSGKAILNVKISPSMMAEISTSDVDANDFAKKKVEEILSNKGSLVWENIKYEITDNGWAVIKAVVYFKDMDDFYKDASEILMTELSGFKLMKTEDGKLVLQEELPYSDNLNHKEGMGKDPKEKRKLTDEQVESRLEQLKAEFKQTKMIMQQDSKDYRDKVTFHLPGEIEEVGVFEKLNMNTVVFELKGKDILANFNKLFEDDAKLREMIKSGNKLYGSIDPYDESFMREMKLGTKLPMKATVVPDSRLNIDYSEDIKLAKKNYNDMIRDLGIGDTEPVVAENDSNDIPEIINVETVGAKLIHKAVGKDNDTKPRHGYTIYETPRYEVYILVDFSCPVSGVEQIKVKSVVDDKGKELASENSYSNIEYLSSDKTRIKITARLEEPSERANSILSLSGSLMVSMSPSQLETEDIGVIELKEGGVSQDGSVEIIEYQKNERLVSFEIKKQQFRKIKGIKLVDSNGLELDTRLFMIGEDADGNLAEITLKFSKPMPKTAEIQIKHMKNSTEQVLLFSLEKISLLGVPLQEQK